MITEDDTLEFKLRDEEVPWPKTQEDLDFYIKDQLGRQHSYGSCVYAMRNVALASFYYASHMVGASGFQAGCAEMSFLGKSRGMKGPWMIVNLENALYPQYDLEKSVRDFINSDDSQKWLKEEAQKKLDGVVSGDTIHPAVHARWKYLAGVK